MDDVELTAIAIVKGEMYGDTFVWDHEWYDDNGEGHYGKWKSQIEDEKTSGVVNGLKVDRR